jgi:phosphate transport system protein
VQTTQVDVSTGAQDVFDVELEQVDARVVRMFNLVSEGLAAAAEAFLADDREIARAVVAADRDIDDLQHELERIVEQRLLCAWVRDPAEVRFLLSVLRIAPELERSGDLIEQIARRTGQRLTADLTGRARGLLHDMGRTAQVMWFTAAEAYIERDDSSLVDLRELDDVLDDLHVELTRELSSRQVSVPAAIELGLVARFYERLGDQAVNVAGRVAHTVHA